MAALPSVPDPIAAILLTLAHNNRELTHSEIGNTAGLTGSQASTYIMRAKQRGWVNRKAWSIYTLTPTGEALARALKAYGHQYTPRQPGQKAGHLWPGDTPSICADRAQEAAKEAERWTSTPNGAFARGGGMRSSA